MHGNAPSRLPRVKINMDFAQLAVKDIASEMGVDASELVVSVSRNEAPFVREVAENLGCMIVLVPNEIINDDHWAVHHKQRHEFGMYSEGV